MGKGKRYIYREKRSGRGKEGGGVLSVEEGKGKGEIDRERKKEQGIEMGRGFGSREG